jgi:tripartite-type tricarboxylate transporter receptor subunit TctC
LLIGGAGQLAVPARGARKYDPVRDFAPLSMIGEFSSLLAIHPSVPAKNVTELVRFVKARPGQVNYASSGTGSTGHLVMEMFRLAAGLKMVQIPYKGAGQALADMMAGQVSMIFSNPLGSLPYVKSGRLRAIAVSSAQRLSALPDIPTVAESGYPGFEATIWQGMLAPAGTPRDIVGRLSGELIKAIQRPDMREWLIQQGLQPMGNTPEQFAIRLKTDIEKWEKVIRDAGIKIEY